MGWELLRKAFAEVQMQGSSGLNAQDRGIKSSAKNVPFVLRLAAPGAGAHGADECTQLMEGSSRAQQHTQPSRGCPSAPVSPYPTGSHTHRHLSPNHTPDPRSNTQLCPTEDTQTPGQTPSIALPLCLLPPAQPPASLPHSVGFPPSHPVPLSLAPGTGRITP